MAVRHKVIIEIGRLIGVEAAARLARSAHEIDNIDNEHSRAFDVFAENLESAIVSAIADGSSVMPKLDFETYLLEHWFDTSAAGIREATANVSAETVVKLAAPTKKVPRTMRALRDLYDYYRTHPGAAKRQKKYADKIVALYLKKVQELVRDLSREFNAGADVDRSAIAAAVKKRIAVVWSRAKTTLETESTRNYNTARRAVYDQSADVTHYLFVCVRDFATTKWCKDRDKLVYKKGSAILDRETPPIHWNCRSELLPLTMQNPVHARLIDDLARRRERNRCKPLPPGWVSSRAA